MRRATCCLVGLTLLIYASSAAAENGSGLLVQWGASGSGAGLFDDPEGIAVDGSGNVYVVDCLNNRIEKFSGMGAFVTQWGSSGSATGQFLLPSGAAVDAAGNVYVADFDNYRIEKFSSSGTFLTQWGTQGSGPGQFGYPNMVAVGPGGNIFVTDWLNNRVEKFSNTGTYLTQWGSAGSGNGQFNRPYGIAVDGSGSVYVADYGNNRIEKFGSAGAYMSQWGSAGSGNGQLNEPVGVAADGFGNVYVADYGNNRIQKFTSAGTYVSQWGSLGTAPGQFNGPYGVAVDATGDIYVCDSVNNRIERFGVMQEITSVADVLNDQGRQVRIRFTANGLDVPGSLSPITGYAVYRRIDPLPAPAAGIGQGGPRSSPAAVGLDGWDYVVTAGAQGDNAYELVVPTLADSNATGNNLSVFLVRALTATPTTYFECSPDSGYSVDNLPPAVPAPFTAAYAGGATNLHWGANTEPDFWYYKLYRGSSSSFIPGPSNLVASRSDTGYVDPGPAGSYYKLSALDVNGNESGYALVTPGTTAGVGGAIPPPAVFLAAPSPNPARSGTTLRFGLPRDARASLVVYDEQGRRMGALVSGTVAAGEHVATWDGRDETGALAPSGLYFARLEADGRVLARRLVIVR